MLKKDNFIFGFIMGLLAPFVGFAVFKYTRLGPLSYTEALQYLFVQPGHRMLTVAISLSLMANAVLFTIYINAHIDHTAKGIFWATLIYALTALSIKTFG
ncbi:MAG: hypothetical protein KTQ13_07565 [Ferruginibacter sp.]|nr:hypothetical protein [Chitinophagaceae bacterium]MBP6286721.1 hypothetical protein [Ferruginibacter sp.]MBU9936490.1 hypothetical protein [Ferruginibacter sp.]